MNRLLAGATCLAALMTTSAAFAVGPTPLLNYDFSEGTGITPQDTTPYNNDGLISAGSTLGGGQFTGPTPSGGTGYLNSGAFGGALWFREDADHFAEFASNFSINAEGSISMFVNLYDLVRRSSFASSNGTGAGMFYLEKQQELIADANEVLVQTGGTTHTSVGRDALTANVWHHLVFTWSQSGGTQSLYVNGTQQPLLNNSYGGSLVTNLLNFRFGSTNRSDVASDQFERRLRGGIDDIAFYSSALTSGQISTIATGSAAAVTANQVVYWNMDDAVGTKLAPSDGGSVALNMYVGAVNGGAQEVTYVVAGGPTLVGGSYAAAQTLDAVDFSGNTANNANKITIPDDPTLDWSKTQGSVVMWINPDSANVRQALFRTTSGLVNIEAEIGANGTNSVFFQIGGGTGLEISPNTAIVNGQWQHLAFVWDNSLSLTDQMRIYRNGTLLSTTAQSGVFATAGNVGDWLIGHRPDVLARNYNGDMADFAIFSQALTADQINDIILNGTFATFFVEPVEEPQPQPQPGTGGGGGAVPEPASLMLLGLSALAVMRRPRR